MSKRVIQVPIDEDLLRSLDGHSRSRSQARSEVIRHAVRAYLSRAEKEDLDRLYTRGYRAIPESLDLAEAQVAALPLVLARESR
jgi:metal-responsive CopG/Arc/MetJ family transcriptional regulator